MDYLMMSLILAFLAAVLLAGIKEEDPEKHFFNVQNSKALRGFWCLVILLVHVPAAYQNKIQDMIGSFAYVGVTFFFMTSGYGLTIASDRKAGSMDHFWWRRLPKLLIPAWIVNICFSVIDYTLFSDRISLPGLLYVNGWVKWLLGCYLIFWLSHRIFKSGRWKIPAAAAVMTLSLVSYFLEEAGIFASTVWSTECCGFLWGICLASCASVFTDFFRTRWLKKWIGNAGIAMVLGIAYLKLKPVFFFGSYLLKIVLGVAITMLVLAANVRFSLGNKVSLFLGDISFEVYLIHGNVFYLITRIKPELSSGLFILISLIATAAMAFLAHLISSFVIRQLYKVNVRP